MGRSTMIGMSKPWVSGSIMNVVPRELIKKLAMPSQRSSVPSIASNASAPNGCGTGAYGWLRSLVRGSLIAPSRPCSRARY